MGKDIEPTRTLDIERIKARADLHAMVSGAVVKASGCGLTRREITDLVMSVVGLLPNSHAAKGGE